VGGSSVPFPFEGGRNYLLPPLPVREGNEGRVECLKYPHLNPPPGRGRKALTPTLWKGKELFIASPPLQGGE